MQGPTIILNGQSVNLNQSEPTVHDLLICRGLQDAACAVEVNQALVPKRHHAEHTLADGDTVEIVTLVGGG